MNSQQNEVESMTRPASSQQNKTVEASPQRKGTAEGGSGGINDGQFAKYLISNAEMMRYEEEYQRQNSTSADSTAADNSSGGGSGFQLGTAGLASSFILFCSF